jgi:hypothetical protein
MLLNTLTLAERERLAYAEGFTTTAALLAQADDYEHEGERAYTMRELVEMAADYLKDGDVDRAGCTLAEALK